MGRDTILWFVSLGSVSIVVFFVSFLVYKSRQKLRENRDPADS